MKNVGKATFEDLKMVGVTSTAKLAEADLDKLCVRIQQITHHKHDPCVWDVFAAIIHEAKTGEKQDWWEWAKVRKAREQDNF